MIKRKFKRKKKNKESISFLIKLVDKDFSIKVRTKNIDIEGFTSCYTCNLRSHWKKLHCGHYLSRFYKAARWDEDNARPQCMMCNLWKRGDPVVFRQNLIKEIGLVRVEAVEAKRAQPTKLTKEFLKEKLGIKDLRVIKQ